MKGVIFGKKCWLGLIIRENDEINLQGIQEIGKQ